MLHESRHIVRDVRDQQEWPFLIDLQGRSKLRERLLVWKGVPPFDQYLRIAPFIGLLQERAEDFSLLVQQHEVHAPRIRADGDDLKPSSRPWGRRAHAGIGSLAILAFPVKREWSPQSIFNRVARNPCAHAAYRALP
jgi:hypothetical protein